MSIISSITGKRNLQEFTGAGDIPVGDMAPNPEVRLRTKERLRRLQRRKSPVKEDLIPDDAEEIEGAEAGEETNQIDSEKGAAPAADPAKSDARFLSMSLAITPPTSTPDWNKQTSLTKVNISAPKQTPSSPPEETATGPTMKGALSLSKKTDVSASDVATAESLIAAPTQSGGPLPALNEQQLLKQGVPMPEHVQSNASLAALKRFKFG